jgi:hypothetical protein
MLTSGRIPEGTLKVDHELVERAMDIFADPNRYELFETQADGPGLAIYGTSKK